MKDKYPSDFGKQLGQIVQDAVQTGDYSQLKSAVNVTVQEIKQTVSNSAKNAWTQNTTTTYTNPPPYNNRPPVYTPPPPPPPRRPAARPQPQPRPVYPQQPVYPQRPVYNGRVVQAYPKQKIPGNAASILLLVFGILGLIPSAITTLALTPAFLFSGQIAELIVASSICIPFVLAFLAMIASGKGIRNRIARYRQYRMIMQGARYYSIDQLAAASGESKEYLVKDLRRMIRRGMFVDAYIDDQETCIMLDRATYQQYLTTKHNLEQRKLQEEQAKQQAQQAPAEPGEKDSAAAIVAEGRSYIRQIKAANDAIPNEEISAKLYRLEIITTKVFSYVETHPQKLPEIRKFMNYYLPTTLKLVNAYREFDSQTVDGNNITSAKKEIQDILDTINTAFENLLDGLFKDDAMDISTDISALNIMLAQDGLTDSDFKSGQ